MSFARPRMQPSAVHKRPRSRTFFSPTRVRRKRKGKERDVGVSSRVEAKKKQEKKNAYSMQDRPNGSHWEKAKQKKRRLLIQIPSQLPTQGSGRQSLTYSVTPLPSPLLPVLYSPTPTLLTPLIILTMRPPQRTPLLLFPRPTTGPLSTL